MTCIQRRHLVMVCIILILIHIKQTVNSIQDNNHRSLSSFNHFRHHHNKPFRNRNSHHIIHFEMQQRHTTRTTTSIPPFKLKKKYSIKSESKHPSSTGYHYTNHRIEEAVHAFHAATSTRRPQNHHITTSTTSRYYDNRKEIHLKKPTMSPYQRIQSLTTTMRIRNAPVSNLSPPPMTKTTERSKKIEDDDDEFYYYDDEDDEENEDNEGEVSNRQDIDDISDADLIRHQGYINLKSLETKNKLSDSDDYNYDYLDDEPTDDENSGSLTNEKWRNYGTAEAVEKSRQRHLTEVQNVSAHITRIHLEAMCKYPRPKIIRISEASKRYVPHCTVLHRCSDDTGCCHSDTQTCVPKRTATVDLHFYVIPIGNTNPIIESLTFVNHTECHCVDRYRTRSTTTAPDNISNSNNSTNSTCQCVRNFKVFEDEIEDDSEYSNGQIQKICRCDCLTDDDSCELLKKGKEHFSVEDRRCISDSRCTAPNCEYGQYIRRIGRCPRMQEKLETARQLSFD